MTENEAVEAAQAVADRFKLESTDPKLYVVGFGLSRVWMESYMERSWDARSKTIPAKYPVKLWVGSMGDNKLELYVASLPQKDEDKAKGVPPEYVFGLVDIEPRRHAEPGQPNERVEATGTSVMSDKLVYAKDLAYIEKTLEGRKAHANVSLDADLTTTVEAMGFDTKLNDDLKIEKWVHAKYPNITIEERVRSSASVPTKFLELQYARRGLAKLDLPITQKRLATFKAKVADCVHKESVFMATRDVCDELYTKHFPVVEGEEHTEHLVDTDEYSNSVTCYVPVLDGYHMLSINLIKSVMNITVYSATLSVEDPSWVKQFLRLEAYVADIRSALKKMGIDMTVKKPEAKKKEAV